MGESVERTGSSLWRRFLMPRFVVTLIWVLRNRSFVSPNAEVEHTDNLQLGPRCAISSFTKIKTGRGVFRTGRNCSIATGCFIAAHDGGIHLGDDCMCGPNVSIESGSYEIGRISVPFREQPATSKGVRIGNNVWIGAGCVVLDGTVLGDNTVVVAGSMVNRRYPPNCILQGNPAKIVLRRKG